MGACANDRCTIPLDTGQDCCHVVRWAPTVLKNVQTQFSGPVYVWMEHLANKFYAWWFIWVLLFEVHHEAECSILKGGSFGPDNDCIPEKASVRLRYIRPDPRILTMS